MSMGPAAEALPARKAAPRSAERRKSTVEPGSLTVARFCTVSPTSALPGFGRARALSPNSFPTFPSRPLANG